MTPETRREADACLAELRDADEHAHASRARPSSACRSATACLHARAAFAFRRGRSGHMGGGVWCNLDDGRVRLDYCGDIVPASPVFAMDPLPPCRRDRHRRLVRRRRCGGARARGRRSPRGSTRIRRAVCCRRRSTGARAELLALVRRSAWRSHPACATALHAQIEGASWLVARDGRQAGGAARARAPTGTPATRCRARRSCATTAWA